MGQLWITVRRSRFGRIHAAFTGWRGVAGILLGASLCAAQAPPAIESLPGPDSPAADDAFDPAARDVLDMDLEQLTRADVVVRAFETEVTSVTRTESTIGRSPAAVYVITEEMIRRSGATSLPEALRLAPGLNVARIGSNKWAITSRGFNSRFSNKLLVLIDGRSIYTPAFAGIFWEATDVVLQDIERIEVIRGPGATMWGENAVNGVINIITKSAKDTQGLLIAAGVGDYDESINVVRYGGMLAPGVHYRVYGKHFERDSFPAFPDAVLPPQDDWRMGRVGFRIDGSMDACDYDTFMLQGDLYNGKAGETGFLAAPPFVFIEPYVHDDYLAGGHVLGNWTRRFSDEESATLQVYFDRTIRNVVFADSSFDTFDVEFQHTFPLNPYHQITWGVEYRNMRSRGDTVNPFAFEFTPARTNIERAGLFVTDKIDLVDDELTLYVGSRFSYNTFTHFEIQPTARLLWAITERRIAWAAVSRAVRTPSVAERDIRQIAPLFDPTFGVIHFQLDGSKNLKAETLVAYELGYREQVTEWFSWDVTAFYNSYDHLIGLDDAGFDFGPPFTLFAVFANNMSASTSGLETSATLDMTDHWQLTGWYALLDIGLGDASPRNQAHLMSSWDLGRRIEFDLIARYVDNVPPTFFGPAVPSYTTLDARLGWRPNRNFELSVVGQNLLETQHVEFVGLSGSPIGIPRGIYGQATWRY